MGSWYSSWWSTDIVNGINAKICFKCKWSQESSCKTKKMWLAICNYQPSFASKKDLENILVTQINWPKNWTRTLTYALLRNCFFFFCPYDDVSFTPRTVLKLHTHMNLYSCCPACSVLSNSVRARKLNDYKSTNTSFISIETELLK